MISIVTFTMGRPKYIADLITSILDMNPTVAMKNYEHIIFYQGIKPSEEEKSLFKTCEDIDYNFKIVELEKNLGIGIGLNIAKQYLDSRSNLIMKADDDCIFRSPDFLRHIVEINNLVGPCVFSPFPVGLINNLGGPGPVADRIVKYSDKLDTYYTLRPVHHVGGFARISPMDLFKKINFPDDRIKGSSGLEDGIFSSYAKALGIPMYYLENALIVEHNESTLGQHERYGKEYFKDNRF